MTVWRNVAHRARATCTFRALASALAGVTVSACANLDSFAFNPTRTDTARPYALNDVDNDDPAGARPIPPAEVVPTALREQVELRTTPGLRLFGVWVARPAPESATAPTVIYHHGNAANIDRFWARVTRLWNLGANVFIYDYRGYGRSEGRPTEAGIYEDGFAATAWVLSRTDIDRTRVFHYGFSLGGAVATHVVLFGAACRGLILESTFASAAALAADSSLVVPGGLLTTLRLDTIGKIRGAARNAANGVLLIHGLADDFVQPRYSQDIYNALEGVDPMRERRELHFVPGANHGDVPHRAGADYAAWLRGFFGR